MKPKAQFMQVTPDMAREWFQLSGGNPRGFRKHWAQYLADALKRGEWLLTHQGVAISESGVLIDGQHRIWAIMNTGISATLLVVTGVPDESALVIDRGLKRTYADVIGISKDEAELPAIAARYLFATQSPSPQQVKCMADAGMIAIHEKIHSAYAGKVKTFTAAPMRLAVAYMLMKGHDEKFVLGQYKALASESINDMTPTTRLFYKLAKDGKVNVHNYDETIVRAIRCFDPTETNLKKLYATDEQKAALRNDMRDALAALIK